MFSTSVSWHTLARGIPKPWPLGWALDVSSAGSHHLATHCSKMALQMSHAYRLYVQVLSPLLCEGHKRMCSL